MTEITFSWPVRYKDKKSRSIVIRPYTDEDFLALKKMYDTFEPKGIEAGIPPVEDYVRDKWLRSITSNFFNIVAIYKREIIGHAALDLSDSNLCPEYLIFIKQGFRNCGIGTFMTQVMKDLAHQSECRKVWLTVRSANTRAIRVFEKARFRFKGGIDIQREMELIIKPDSSSPRHSES